MDETGVQILISLIVFFFSALHRFVLKLDYLLGS